MFKRYDVSPAPVVLGLVLGRIMELSFRQAMLIDGVASFYTRPLTVIFLVLAVAAIITPIVQSYRAEKKLKQGGN